MNKLELVVLITLGTMIGNRMCDVGDYIYKKRKRAKIIKDAREHGYRISARCISDEYTIEELIDKYGNLL